MRAVICARMVEQQPPHGRCRIDHNQLYRKQLSTQSRVSQSNPITFLFLFFLWPFLFAIRFLWKCKHGSTRSTRAYLLRRAPVFHSLSVPPTDLASFSILITICFQLASRLLCVCARRRTAQRSCATFSGSEPFWLYVTNIFSNSQNEFSARSSNTVHCHSCDLSCRCPYRTSRNKCKFHAQNISLSPSNVYRPFRIWCTCNGRRTHTPTHASFIAPCNQIETLSK